MLRDHLNDKIKLRMRSLLATMGLEIGTYAGSFAEHRLKLLHDLGIRTVWDVGANIGQYACLLRGNGYRNHIVSLEPGSGAHASLERRARGDALWTVIRTAAGCADDEATLNISANGQSSSILPMLSRHVTAAPRSHYVGSERVAVHRLDELAEKMILPTPAALKLDVQGFEMSALSGATRLLKDCVLIEVELSLVPLYEEGAKWLHVIDCLAGHGFRLCDVDRVYYDEASGDLLQMDGLFRRDI